MIPRAFLLLLVFAASASAQNQYVEIPKPYSGPPATQKDKDRRESMYRFVYGLLCEKEDKLLEALGAFEEAAKLDPDAAGAFKAQVPLLLMLDRPRDALAATKRALELDANDHESWFLAARLHKGLGESKEYLNALEKGLAVPGLVDDQPQLAQQLYHDLGQYREVSDQFVDAIKAYRAAAKILEHPDVLLEHGPFSRESIVARCAETYEKIGDLHRRLKQYPEAIKAYEAAQGRAPESAARINLHLARLHQEVNDWPQALTAVEGYLRLLPQGTEAYQMKIDLLDKLGRDDEVVPWLERAVKADALNVNLRLILARQYVRHKQFALADDTYVALADESPNDDVYKALFQLKRADNGKFMLTKLDGAIRLASKKPIEAGTIKAADQTRAMLAVLKDDAPLAKQLIDAAFRPDQADRDLAYETRLFLAMLADKYGRLNQAEAFYRKALDVQGQNNEPSLYGGLLRILWKSKKYEDVVAVCEKGLERSQATNHLLFYNELAKAHSRLGNLRKAEVAADKAFDIAADRDRLFALHIKVRILTQAEKYTQAEALCKKLLEENTVPGDIVDIRYLLSGVYSAAKKIEQCEAQLLEILKLDPTNATANNDLGYMWADQNKNLKEAEDMIRKAIDLDRHQRKTGAHEDQDNAAYVDSLGWVLFRRGDLDGARKEMERAVALPDGDEPTLWDHLGDVYARQSMLIQARNAYERAVQLFEEERTRKQDERYRDARRKLEQIKMQVRN